MFKSLLLQFCDLVLGPEPSNRKAEFISGDLSGQIFELSSDEPDEAEQQIERLLRYASNKKKAVALLGAEPVRWKNIAGVEKAIIMPAKNASQMLFAAHELIASKAVDLIVMQEIFLKSERTHFVLQELRKLKLLIFGSKVAIVLINPNSSERKLAASELQLLCSPSQVLRSAMEKTQR